MRSSTDAGTVDTAMGSSGVSGVGACRRHPGGAEAVSWCTRPDARAAPGGNRAARSRCSAKAQPIPPEAASGCALLVRVD
eukprot:5245786-Prymnesium_polylepis.1